MIDEKKIEEAKEEIFDNEFELYSYDIEYPDGNIYIYRMFTSDQLKRAISFGAHWVISEFLKDLWHDASEEPRMFAEVVAEAKITDSIKTYISFKKSGALFTNWEAYSRAANITRWLYIDDLLEQKGGE